MKRKAQTVVCPHCGEDFDVKENGRYICPECENCVDVDDWFDTPHVMQPDGVTCGWATTKWLLSAFGLEVPSDRQLERELHVRKGREGLSGALVQGFNAPKVEIEHINDWEGSRYRYCNEFLVDSETLDKDDIFIFANISEFTKPGLYWIDLRCAIGKNGVTSFKLDPHKINVKLEQINRR